MAVSNSSTEACVVFEKACTKCGVVKQSGEFYVMRAGLRSECKSCTKQARDGRAERRKRLTGRRSTATPEQRRMQRWLQKGYSKQEALEKSKINGHEANRRIPSLQKKYDALAKQNARQAWDYWIREKANKKWMKAHYADEPWKNPRLSEAEQYRLQYRLDPEFCLREKMRAHMRRRTKHDKIGDIMRDALKRGGKSGKVEWLLGYTIADLRKHLESQFTYRMNWDRFKKGDIHIDHILPISSFNFKEIGDSEWKACWDLPNLRPLWAKDNIAKSNKLLFLL